MQKIDNYLDSPFIGFFMAAAAGFSDVFGFLALDRLFTAHITGNVVISISYFVDNVPGVIPKLIAIPLFMLIGCIISAIIEHHGHTKRMLFFWIILEIVLFIGLMVGGIVYLPKTDIESAMFLSIAMLPICAMAIHNTLTRTYMARLPPSTAMTSNLTQFVVDFTAFCLSLFPGKLTPREHSSVGVKRFGNVLLGFIVGGLIAAFGYIYYQFVSLIILIAFLAILLTYIQFIQTEA